jgi:hypothetical protein
MVIVWAVLLLILLVTAAVAADFSSKVIRVHDGDTIDVLHKLHPERIRLSGIDCPEKCQAYGNNAKHAASKLVFGKEVTSRPTARTSTGAPLETYSCWMERTSIKNSSSKGGAGGIGSMRRGTRYLKGWRRKRERLAKACGLIRHPAHRGSGESEAGEHTAARSINLCSQMGNSCILPDGC